MAEGTPAPLPEWLTAGEAAQHLNVPLAVLRGWADDGTIPCQRTSGGHRRFLRSALDAFLEQQRSSERAAS